ncbi:MAG: thioredoxin-disulfide reductase [Desulfurococcales archaeon]|nr:thioredoxin-disulfide reductase [Desulfurococcales archaeon]
MSLRLGGLKRVKVPRGEEYDIVVVGGGPAGLSAAIYTTRFLLSTLVVSKDVGGQLNLTNWIDDYPGMGGLEASKLVEAFRSHAEMFGAKIVTGVTVTGVEKLGDGRFRVTGSRGLDVTASAVILAVGSERRKLRVPGEDRLAGRGVSYCSVCDAPLFKGKDAVVVVGGGDAAFEGAVLLSGYVKKVYLVHRRRGFRAKPYLVEEARSRPNIEFVLDTVVKEIRGEDRVESVVVVNKVTGEERELKVDGIFIEIGNEPPREFFERVGVETDKDGYVKVDEFMRTSVEGIFAAGDCTTVWKGFRQVITAAAMGAVAAYSAYNYLTEKGLYKPKPLTQLKA